MCIDFNNRFRRWQTQFKYLAVCGSVRHITVVSFSMSSQTLIVSISDILHWQMYVNSLNDHFMLMSCDVMTVFTRHNTIMELDILKLMDRGRDYFKHSQEAYQYFIDTLSEEISHKILLRKAIYCKDDPTLEDYWVFFQSFVLDDLFQKE